MTINVFTGELDDTVAARDGRMQYFIKSLDSMEEFLSPGDVEIWFFPNIGNFVKVFPGRVAQKINGFKDILEPFFDLNPYEVAGRFWTEQRVKEERYYGSYDAMLYTDTVYKLVMDANALQSAIFKENEERVQSWLVEKSGKTASAVPLVINQALICELVYATKNQTLISQWESKKMKRENGLDVAIQKTSAAL